MAEHALLQSLGTIRAFAAGEGAFVPPLYPPPHAEGRGCAESARSTDWFK